MRWPSWHPWGKWVLLCSLTGAVVMVMGSDEGSGPAKAGRAKMPQAATASFRPAEAMMQPPPVAKVEFERLFHQARQSGGGEEIGNMFNTVSWHAPAPPTSAPLPPQAPLEPAAPPLPLTYLGVYKSPDSPAQIIILAWADRVFTVSEGDVIDGTYRIGPAAAGSLEITYLPLNIKQSLNMGGMS